MDPHLIAAGWIDRFAARLQLRSVMREDAVLLAAQVWEQSGTSIGPEHAADAVCATWSGPNAQ